MLYIIFYIIGCIFKCLARIAIPLFKRGAKAVDKRALQAGAEVGQEIGEIVRQKEWELPYIVTDLTSIYLHVNAKTTATNRENVDDDVRLTPVNL